MRAHHFLHLAQPRGIELLRNAHRYGREHELSSRRRHWVSLYQDSRRYALDLLPRHFTLDGVIVDIGANQGDFTGLVRDLEPRAQVVSIEPAPGPFAQLTQRFAGDPNVVLHNVALADREGLGTLNVSEVSEFSSLLEQQLNMSGSYSVPTRVVERVEVPLRTLDSLISEPVRLLKIDVQGYEIPALSGASATLSRTDLVIMEVTFTSHYQGDSSFGQLIEFMAHQDFALFAVGAIARHHDQPLWADACFTRRTP